MKRNTSPDPGSAWLPAAATIVVVGAFCLLALGELYLSASAQATEATVNGVFPRSISGLTIVQGFKESGGTGVRLAPGSVAFLMIPLVSGLVTLIPGVKGFVKSLVSDPAPSDRP
ncbi:hypothetical protein ABH924_004821 [Arthrobacter sp. GAS37]|uniref:hypothetical protein n=1 Tax=Arthrobacter sp. GAS37 TaxID=3156261 RepID=UPI00383602F0